MRSSHYIKKYTENLKVIRTADFIPSKELLSLISTYLPIPSTTFSSYEITIKLAIFFITNTNYNYLWFRKPSFSKNKSTKCSFFPIDHLSS